jgi:hypothetical protein
MDKYEFNIKVEQLKKMVKAGDYETAMRIADSVDWSRVHNASLLSVVSEVYEKNREYGEAKEILLLSYERGTKGKRILYKLTILALNEGNIDEAEEFYQEFYNSAPEDPRNYVLRYLILRARGADIDQMILTLEKYNKQELDEEWLYELAELYHEAGRSEDCVKTCDNIMLMFGLGKYVEKAIDLKTNKEGRPLTEYQQGLIDNRSKYEERFKVVSENLNSENANEDTNNSVNENANENANKDIPESDSNDNTQDVVIEDSNIENEVVEENTSENEELAHNITNNEVISNQDDEIVQNDYEPEQESYYRNEREYSSQTEDEEQLSRELSSIREDLVEEQEESDNDKTKILANIRAALEARDMSSLALEDDEKDGLYEEMGLEIEDLDEEDEEESFYKSAFVEVEDKNDSIKFAAEKLKEIYEVTGVQKKIAKVSAAKINEKGLAELAERIGEKDLIIDDAGSLDEISVNEIMDFASNSDKSFIFVDTHENLELFKKDFPEVFELCGGKPTKKKNKVKREVKEDEGIVIKAEEPAKSSSLNFKVNKKVSPEVEKENVVEKDYEVETKYVEPEENKEEPVVKVRERKIFRNESIKHEEVEEEKFDPAMEEELDLESFIAYADEYAKRIDCAIPGRSMNALYERAEIMEEDGITLNRKNAEMLIEEAADKAEKPPILRRIAGLFSQKYDKNGLLILKEEHFV